MRSTSSSRRIAPTWASGGELRYHPCAKCYGSESCVWGRRCREFAAVAYGRSWWPTHHAAKQHGASRAVAAFVARQFRYTSCPLDHTARRGLEITNGTKVAGPLSLRSERSRHSKRCPIWLFVSSVQLCG